MIYRLLIAGSVLIAATSGGFLAGKQWCEGVQAEIDLKAKIEQNSREAARQIREADLLARALDLEEQALAQPANNNCGLDVNRVRRLNLR